MEINNMYKDCSELPIFNFFEILNNNDYKFLLRKKYRKKEIDEELGFKLREHFKSILAEYNHLTDNKKLLRRYNEELRIEFMEYRYNITSKLISLYVETGEFEILLIIKDLGWQLNSAKDVLDQLTRIRKNLIGLKNKVKIAKANFIKKYGNKREKTSKFDLEKQCVNLEVGIPLPYKINMYKDSIKRFVQYNNILEAKISKNNG